VALLRQHQERERDDKYKAFEFFDDTGSLNYYYRAAA
jgi:hypothetical protein